MNITKIKRDIGWQPRHSLATGLRETVQWYLDNPEWIAAIRKQGSYTDWINANYSNREKRTA
jgi:dTDP-glucose 4,6-dehydratase